MSNRWRVVAVGLVAGLLAGLFGVGGGIVIVPGLVFVAGFGQRLAHGVSLGAIVLIAASGTIGYGVEGEVHWPAAVALTAGALVGIVVGTALLERVSQTRLQAGFGLLLVAGAIRMLFETPDAADVPSLSGAVAVTFVVLGFVAGLLSGLMGVGGGIILVPALTIVGGLPLLIAKGTSLAVILPTSLVGSFRNHSNGNLDVGAAALAGAGGVASTYLASKVSLVLDPDLSAILFAALLVVAAIRMLGEVRRERRRAKTSA